jgi:predicted transcriptional regulator
MKSMREIIDAMNEARLASKRKIDEIFGMSREEKRARILGMLQQWMTYEDVAAKMGMSVEDVRAIVDGAREQGGIKIPTWGKNVEEGIGKGLENFGKSYWDGIENAYQKSEEKKQARKRDRETKGDKTPKRD